MNLVDDWNISTKVLFKWYPKEEIEKIKRASNMGSIIFCPNDAAHFMQKYPNKVVCVQKAHTV